MKTQQADQGERVVIRKYRGSVFLFGFAFFCGGLFFMLGGLFEFLLYGGIVGKSAPGQEHFLPVSNAIACTVFAPLFCFLIGAYPLSFTCITRFVIDQERIRFYNIWGRLQFDADWSEVDRVELIRLGQLHQPVTIIHAGSQSLRLNHEDSLFAPAIDEIRRRLTSISSRVQVDLLRRPQVFSHNKSNIAMTCQHRYSFPPAALAISVLVGLGVWMLIDAPSNNNWIVAFLFVVPLFEVASYMVVIWATSGVFIDDNRLTIRYGLGYRPYSQPWSAVSTVWIGPTPPISRFREFECIVVANGEVGIIGSNLKGFEKAVQEIGIRVPDTVEWIDTRERV